MFQEFFRHGRCSQGDTGESWNQIRRTVSAIEGDCRIPPDSVAHFSDQKSYSCCAVLS